MKNKYNRKSEKVFNVTCPVCGESHEVLEPYAYYFIEYKKTQPQARLVCPGCKKGELKI